MVRRVRNRRFPSVGALLLGLGLTVSASSGAQQTRVAISPLETFRRSIGEAEESLQLGETQIAESRYRRAIFEGWMMLGALAEESGDLPEARSAYETAITSAAEVRPARLALAALLMDTEEYDEAEGLLRLLIAEDKNDFEARRLLADGLQAAGREEEAIQELEQLVSMKPEDLETTFYLSTAYLANARITEADFLLGQLTTAIGTPQAHILVGRAYRDYEYFDRARHALVAAVEMDPEVRRARFYLATVELRQKGHQALDAAMELFEEELEIDPDDPMTNLYLGMALVDGRRYEEAMPHLEAASRSPSIRADALQFLGKSLLGEDRLEEAITAFRQGLEAVQAEVGDDSDTPLTEVQARQISQFHYQLAQALRGTGEPDAAAYHFDAAKEFQARQKESAQDLLDRYLATGTGEDDLGSELRQDDVAQEEPPEELGISRARESIESSLAGSYFNLGVLQAKAGKRRRAADLFQQAARLDDGLPRVHYSLGVARFNAEDFRGAVEPLTRALEETPGDPQLEQMLALAWFNSAEYERAAELLERIEARAANRGLEYAYGVALVRSGKAEEAERVFARLLARNADWPELLVLLAQAHAQQGDYDTAGDLLGRAIVLDPDVAEAHGTLGEMHLRKGELEEAEAELKAELQANPADSRTMFTLATALDLAQKSDEAIGVLESLLDMEPRLAKGRYLLGKILLARGSDEEALDQLEAAATLAPEDANIHYQLGKAYQNLGRREEAREEFDTFRRLKSADK